MAIQGKVRKTADDYIEELKGLIWAHFPEAEFEVYRQDAHEYDLDVYGDFEDMTDVQEVIRERPTDILLESGIHIHVLPLGRRISSS